MGKSWKRLVIRQRNQEEEKVAVPAPIAVSVPTVVETVHLPPTTTSKSVIPAPRQVIKTKTPAKTVRKETPPKPKASPKTKKGTKRTAAKTQTKSKSGNRKTTTKTTK